VSKLQKEIDRLEGMLLLQTDLLYQLLLPFYVRRFSVRHLHRTVFNRLVANAVELFDTQPLIHQPYLRDSC